MPRNGRVRTGAESQTKQSMRENMRAQGTPTMSHLMHSPRSPAGRAPRSSSDCFGPHTDSQIHWVKGMGAQAFHALRPSFPVCPRPEPLGEARLLASRCDFPFLALNEGPPSQAVPNRPSGSLDPA